MTRKKSNVKALALAVTCAILAGGYSALNPVYAAAPVYHDVVKYDSANQTLDYEFDAGGGIGTAAIQKINFGNIVLDSSIGTSPSITVGSFFSIGGSDGSINAANGKFTVSGAGAITATSLSLDTIGDVTTAINGKAAQTDVATNSANIQILEDKTTKISYDSSTNTTTVNGIRFHTDTGSGISDINDGIIKFSKNGTKDIVQINSDLMFNDNATGHAATLTLEGVKTLNGLSDGSSVIKAGNGSVVGGVTFDSGNITGVQNATVGGTLNVDNIMSLDGHNGITVADMATTKYNTDKISYNATDGTTIAGNVMVNEGADNQVKITDEGIVVGLTSTVIGSDGVYAGGHDYGSAKAAIDGKDGKIKGANGEFGVDEHGNVTTTGDIKGKDITVDGKLSANGDAVVGGDLSVAGKANFTQEATFAGGITTDAINEATADKGVTIDGVLLKDKGISAAGGAFTVDGATGNVKTSGDIEGQNIKANGALSGASLDVTNDAAVGGKLDVTGDTTLKGKLDVTGDATFGGDLTVAKKITGQSLYIGATGNEFTVDTVGHMTSKSAQIGSVGITNTGVITGVTSLTTDALTVNGAFTTKGNLGVTGDLIATGAINGKTISISDGGSIAGVSFATGGNLTATTGTIAGVSFATGGNVSGINNLTATGTIQGATLKVNDNNLLDDKGLKAEKDVIYRVVIDDASITSTGANGLEVENVKLNNGAITATSATIGGVNTLDNTGITVAADKKIQVGNTKIEDGSIAVSTNTKLTDQALNLNATNTWTAAGGLVADKASINGVTIGETAGKAVFNKAGKSTTIDGDAIETGKITADELLIDKISLGKGSSSNITIDKDGHVQTKGDIKITDAAGNVMSKLSQDQATFGKDADNQTTITNGKLKAKAKNTANQQAEFNFDENGLTVSGQNAAGATSSFGFNAATGIGTFTGQDGTTTAINGSAITSTNGAATGVLNGSSLTLDDGTNSTVMNAGGATFTGAAGEKGGTQTIINGGTITTDTLNVERINLGGEVIDKGAAGVEANSKLYMDAQGNFRAAGGNFKVDGATGAMTNTVGNTTLKTDNVGASMNYAGTVDSNISVADGKAKMAVGANAAVTATDGKVEIKGGTQTVTTTDVGTVFENSAHNTPFGGGSETKTTINGNEITTGKITTDQLVIKGNGSGDADGTGNGSIALGGDGSIKSNIKDTTTGIESTFETKADKIGSVITGGTVELRQELDANTGKITNKAGDMSTELDNNGFTVKQNGKTDVKIADGDVTVTNDKNTANPGQEVHLSDLGSLNNLDGELAARDEYQDNKTAVGAINAEAGIRREEVARLDNRIDDVNNRVDKVGAMAAAIASLKSIGYDPQAPSEFSIGLGQYKGETGVAMGFFHYPNKNFMINVSLSTAGGETMGGIGATWRFGHKSPQKLLDEQREAQAKKELAAAEKYQAAAKLAKEAQERAEYAAKLARQAQVSADNAKAAADATQAKHFQ